MAENLVEEIGSYNHRSAKGLIEQPFGLRGVSFQDLKSVPSGLDFLP